MANKKYKCPKCGYDGIEAGMPACPECGKKFQWSTVKETKTKPRVDETKDTLLKLYYWFRLFTFICPIFGWIELKLNTAYKNNINRKKAETYDYFFKDTLRSTIAWVVLILMNVIAAVVARINAKNTVGV